MHLDKVILAKIIQKHIKSPKSTEIANFIISNSSSDFIQGIISMFVIEESIPLFQPGDYFKTKVPYQHNNKHFYEDKLIDLGLFENGYVFGKIIKSNDWNNEHDPYYVTMKCQLFYGDDLPFEHNLRIFDIEQIQKSEIPHYNGQYITRIIDETFERVSDIEEHNVNE